MRTKSCISMGQYDWKCAGMFMGYVTNKSIIAIVKILIYTLL